MLVLTKKQKNKYYYENEDYILIFSLPQTIRSIKLTPKAEVIKKDGDGDEDEEYIPLIIKYNYLNNQFFASFQEGIALTEENSEYWIKGYEKAMAFIVDANQIVKEINNEK